MLAIRRGQMALARERENCQSWRRRLMRWAPGRELEGWWKRGGPDALALRRRGFGVRIPETAGQDH